MVDKYYSTEIDTRLIWILTNILTKIPEVYNIVEKNVKLYNDWKPWMLVHVTRRYLHQVSIRSSKKNPFKHTYVMNTKKLAEKLGIVDDYIFNINVDMNRSFSNVEGIEIIPIGNFNQTIQDIRICDVLIVTNDDHTTHQTNSYNFNLHQNQTVRIQRHRYELRFVSITKLNQNQKFDIKIFARHGNFYNQWWIQDTHDKWTYQSDDGIPEDINSYELDVAIYIRKEKQNEIENRDLYMKFIGSQNHVKCGCHKYHLITDRHNEKECVNEGCENKVSYSCPELKCNVKICKKCFKTLPRNQQNEIFSRNRNIMGINEDTASEFSDINSEEELIEPYENSDDDSSLDQESNFEFTHDDLIDDLNNADKDDEDNIYEIDMNFIGDKLDDNDITNEDEDDTLFNELIPTTNTLMKPKKVISENDNWLMRTNGHVLLNQTGKLLTRKNRNMNTNKYQKSFVQSIAATVNGNCIPLLYPEGMLFPSIFWKTLNDGSIIGATPSCIMNQENANTRDFALHRDSYRARLTSPGTQTSTNPRYIAHMFDVLSNLAMNRCDSRLILNRGLVVSSSESGLALCNRSDDRLYDSVDSKKNG